VSTTDDAPQTLMLGNGWFPHQLGGLERYYGALLEQLPEASGVVVGHDVSMPPRVTGVSGHDRPLALRMFSVWRAAQRAASHTEVVDAHFALYALAPLWLGRLRDKPLIVHFHGPWAEESVATGDHSGLRLAIRSALERAVYARADAAVTLTSAFRRVLVERYGVRPWLVSVEPPGVDLAGFTPGSAAEARRRFGLEPDAFVAVAVRRLVARMGLELLIGAWCDARSDLPHGSTLLIAGEGPLRHQLEQAAAVREAGDSVQLLGRVREPELRELYRAADVAVVPSLSHEGFGLVALEAAACGTPSIVTDVGGLPEAIAALDPSLVVPAGDRDAMRDRLLRARSELPSRAATRAYVERFTWSTAAQRQRSIARRVAARSRAPQLRASGDDRLKVVYLDHTAQLSGGEIALLRLLPHLSRVHPHVVLGEDGPLAGRLQLAGISCEVMPFDGQARDLHREQLTRGTVSPAVAASASNYVLRLAARLRKLAPDLVHTNSLKAGIVGSLASRLAGVPVIWHVRDRIAEDYMPVPAVRLVRYMTRHLPAAVVANSSATLETLALRGRGNLMCAVIPEVVVEVPVRPRTTNGALTFGVVGRLAPWKGQDFFLRAFARAFPDGRERAVVVGGALFGEDDYAAGLPRVAHELVISDRVELRGHRDDIWEELAGLDVLVHSSLTPEPFGQVILEGMAAGVPVVAAGAGGPAEILRNDVTGLLYEPRSVPSLALAMRRMRDPILRVRLSTAARASLGPYSPTVVASRMQELYMEVLARRAGAP
jgi:glycosyltransferase involved in cell wall biosynthesis